MKVVDTERNDDFIADNAIRELSVEALIIHGIYDTRHETSA